MIAIGNRGGMLQGNRDPKEPSGDVPMNEQRRGVSRRQFLKCTAAGVAAATIVPRHVLGGPGQTPPSAAIFKG